MKHGRVLPLKLELSCGTAVLGEDDVAPPRTAALTPQGAAPVDLTTIDPDAGEANDSGLLFRFSAPGTWIYNLATDGLPANALVDATIALPDGREVVGRFALK